MTYYEDLIRRGKATHGDKFDPSELAAKFIPYYNSDERIKVRTRYSADSATERTGTVGVTTGWRPAFLLMHRSSDHGSSDVLSDRDEIIAVKRGSTYVPL